MAQQSNQKISEFCSVLLHRKEGRNKWPAKVDELILTQHIEIEIYCQKKSACAKRTQTIHLAKVTAGRLTARTVERRQHEQR